MPYGRRLGWYAIARATKPRTIVETGVHDGLGSTVLLRALERNAAEGRPGSLISFDPVPSAGWLIPSSLRVQHQLVEGPAPDLFTAVLRDRQVDMFIHDSDHRYEHETAEFESILDFVAPGAVLLSDNAHAGTALRDFCERHNLSFRFFREAPRQHWYPGAGIGLALVSGAAKPEREVPHPRVEA
jgi:predicted O-methyltransferase YrrM